MNFAILGVGRMGEAIMYDLLQNTTEKIIACELSESRLNELKKKYDNDRVIFQSLNLNPSESNNELFELFKNYEVNTVFGAIDYSFNAMVSTLCIKYGMNYLDLGGNPEIVQKQYQLHENAFKRGVTIIPDCGLAPGMANILAASLLKQFDELETCKIRVGGLPKNPKTILKYQQVFNIRGLTNEYLENAEVIRDGEYKQVESLTELENFKFDLLNLEKEFECFQTAGGTSSLPRLYKGKIKQLEYKTIRYPGHCQFIQFLKEFKLFNSEPYKDSPYSPREMIEHHLEQGLPQSGEDIVLVKIDVHGKINGEMRHKTYELLDSYNKNTQFSAMARTTAYPISILGIMISKGVITAKGVVPGEEVTPYTLFINELKKREIEIKSND